MILIPASMLEELSPEALEVILMHELAHISRADYFINILQSIVETLLFFNPFAWKISSVIRREREHCCDDSVIAYTQQPFTYARALASLANKQVGDISTIALAATGQQKQPLLLKRIKRIVEMKTQPIRSAHIIAACSLAAMIIAVSIACFSPSLAQRSNKHKEPAPVKQQSFTDSSRTIVVEENGKSTRLEDMSPEQRAEVKRKLQVMADTLESLKNLGPMISQSLAGLGDSIHQVVQQGLASVDWNEINKQIDEATKQVANIDWDQISREVNRGLCEANKAMTNPKVKAEMRRAMAMAQRDIQRERERYQEDRQRIAEDARRDAEEARRDAAEMRREMEELRRELQKDKEEMKRVRNHERDEIKED
jgi:paraquat-inducible protein B